MKLPRRAAQWIYSHPWAHKLYLDRAHRTLVSATVTLIVNLTYAVFNAVMGALTESIWLISMCAYYTILAAVRFGAVTSRKKQNERRDRGVTVASGVLLMLLGVTMAWLNYVSLSQGVATKYGTILMITIATYTFTKLTLAIIRATKKRQYTSAERVVAALRYSEVAASVLTMQRSMLVSFGGMPKESADIFNILLGAAVAVFIAVMGILLIIRRKNGKV